MNTVRFGGAAAILCMALALLPASPTPSFAQHRASSSAASEVASGERVSRTWVNTEAGGITDPESDERTVGFATGIFAGALIGGAAGTMYGIRHLDPCREDCLLSPGFEMVLYAIMGGSTGGVLGGLTGYLWPRRSADAARVGVHPARTGGVAVSLTIRR